MIATPIARNLLRLEYSLLRAPLRALDAQLSHRLPDGSRLRSSVERGLAGCDAVAARLLRDPSLANRAALIRGHADAIERSVNLAEQAEALRDAATERQRAADEARQERSKAARQARQELTQAIRDTEKAKREAEARAREAAAAKKREAAQQATTRRRRASAQRAAEQRRVAERAERASAPAKVALKEAAKEKAAASERRAEARKLSTLAEAEKRRRAASSTSQYSVPTKPTALRSRTAGETKTNTGSAISANRAGLRIGE